MRSPNIFRKVWTKIIKTIAYNTKRRRPRFRKKSKAVFLSIRHPKTSQTQDVKSQSTKRGVQKLAQPKRYSAFEQETRFVSSGEIRGSSQNSSFNYNQSNKPTRAQKAFLERAQRRFGNFCFGQETKAVFISIRCPKTSQTHDVKSKNSKRSLRKLAQPKVTLHLNKKHV